LNKRNVLRIASAHRAPFNPIYDTGPTRAGRSRVRLFVRRRLHDTGQAVRVGGTYVTCRHLVCADSQAECGLTPSGRGTPAGVDIAVTAISVPAVTIYICVYI